jgi:hypothetical protein
MMGPTRYGHGRPRSGTRVIWGPFLSLQRFWLSLSFLFLWSVSCNETTSYRNTIAVSYILPYTAYTSPAYQYLAVKKEVVHLAVPSGFASQGSALHRLLTPSLLTTPRLPSNNLGLHLQLKTLPHPSSSYLP